MTTWHWVRHGPTHQKSFTGWRDVPADLSDARAVARLTAALPRDAVIVSAAARAAAAMRRIEATYRPETIIVVAHFGVILTQVQATMGVSAAQVLQHRIDPLSVTTLRPGDGMVERINHLP